MQDSMAAKVPAARRCFNGAMTRPMPALYVSHGSPMIAIDPSPAAAFLQRLGPAVDAAFGRPRAVVMVSPHTSTHEPVVQAAARHMAVHDFGGFPAELYRLRYDAPGDPALAEQVAQRLLDAGLPVHVVGEGEEGALDHGIWTVMRRAWPAADVPVVPLSLVPHWSAQQQWAMGAALAPLREQGVLVIGSGSLTHNLRRFMSQRGLASGDAPVAADVQAFRDWVHDRARARDWAALRDWPRAAPFADDQHPTDEHWLPFYVGAGAGGEEAVPHRIHASVDGGLLAMDAYAFGPGAVDLARALEGQMESV
jgi:4,5-DOPA dioxygenase extradiol